MTTDTFSQEAPWATGMKPGQALPLAFHFSPADAPWSPGPFPGMEYRDSGMTLASRSKVSARHIRIARNAGSIDDAWRCMDTDFHFFYVLQGTAELENGAGQRHTLRPGLAAWQPGFLWHRLHSHSPDFEMLELMAPAAPMTVTGKDTPLPANVPREGINRPGQYLFEEPGSYVVGEAPRTYLSYRSLGTTDVTGGRIMANMVKALQPLPGGTGWHVHTMSQLFWVIRGSAGFQVEGRDDITRVVAYDAVCVPDGLCHNVPSFTADYWLLEVCFPAEYETIGCTPSKAP